ncbi:MAG: glucose-6-phosphate isomerase [Magnetococcales bacterium]|nr:glucose-6-phosphate isomerase [Magnetococcales bacterium]
MEQTGKPLQKTAEWIALENHYDKIRDIHLRDLFDKDPERFSRFSRSFPGFLVDFSKNRLNNKTLSLLLDLAKRAGVEKARDLMFQGAAINWTEKRPALHPALRNRSDSPMGPKDQDVMPEVTATLDRMKAFAEGVRTGKLKGSSGKRFRTVVNIGIGGSHLGPEMITRALHSYGQPKRGKGIAVRFLANIDPTAFKETVEELNPQETLFIVSSKSFTTTETLTNARSAWEWAEKSLGEKTGHHFAGVTAQVERAREWGIDPERVFPLWEWVGGRYSWASAIGLCVACRIGFDHFEELLQGAHEMDRHFQEAPLEENIPVLMAMIGIWYRNFFNTQTQAILPYSHALGAFPAFVQQLDMESNGKSIDLNGERVRYQTGPVVWGESGTLNQHSFFQLLHQGKFLVPADFIGFVEPLEEASESHGELMAHFFAQSQALMLGRNPKEVKKDLLAREMSPKEIAPLLPHRTFRGNRPSTTLLIDQLTPRNLGALIALYEMKVFVQGIIWRINSFDQWGVELGKQLAEKILNEGSLVANNGGADLSHHDPSTRGLLQHFAQHLE